MPRRRRGKNQTARAGRAEKGGEGEMNARAALAFAAAKIRANNIGTPQSFYILSALKSD